MDPKEKRKTSVRYAPEVRERAVRLVLSLDASRLARNNRDWH